MSGWGSIMHLSRSCAHARAWDRIALFALDIAHGARAALLYCGLYFIAHSSQFYQPHGAAHAAHWLGWGARFVREGGNKRERRISSLPVKTATVESVVMCDKL